MLALRRISLVLGAAGLGVVAAGCPGPMPDATGRSGGAGGACQAGTCGISPFAKVCKADAECEGGNDKDIGACAAKHEAYAAVAAAYDCTDAFGKVIDCYSKTSTCRSGQYIGNCSAQEKALMACEEAASCAGVDGGACMPSGTPPSGDYGAYCFAKALCQGGNDNDVGGCVAQVSGEQKAAAAYDCADPYTKYSDCFTKTSTCKNRNYHADCSAEGTAYEACKYAASARK